MRTRQTEPEVESIEDDEALDDAEVLAEPEPGPEPVGSWEPIETAPHDGRDIWVRWGESDDNGRTIYWKHGRRYENRRWVAGGRWAPRDDLSRPLPAQLASHWYKPPGYDEPVAEEQAA